MGVTPLPGHYSLVPQAPPHVQQEEEPGYEGSPINNELEAFSKNMRTKCVLLMGDPLSHPANDAIHMIKIDQAFLLQLFHSNIHNPKLDLGMRLSCPNILGAKCSDN